MNKIILLFLIVALTGCADSVSFEAATNMQKVGFLHGLWHGVIFPFSFITSIFMSEVSVYAIYNTGVWYDFGFFIGVGGLASSYAAK